MQKEKFLKDVDALYSYLDTEKNKLNKLFKALEDKSYDKLKLIDEFAKKLDLQEINDNIRLSLITRIVNCRDDSLVQVLKKLEYGEDEIVALQEKAYIFTRDFWQKRHNDTINFIEKNNLLSPFYKEVFKGMHKVGEKISFWQSSWMSKIINGVNKELLENFEGDEKAVFKYLEENNLFDLGHGGQIADRSYSMLEKKDDSTYESKAYIKAFKNEVTAVIDELENFVDNLLELEDEIFNQKWEHINYLQSIIQALSERRTNELVTKWAQVDKAWMSLTTPIQIGHPLEYYEDHFRKAVALEWDIRLSNPNFEKNNLRVEKIKSMFEDIFNSLQMAQNANEYKKIFDFSLNSLQKVQLYISRPALFYGAEFNGLFSAQVVPNDEIVSKEFGKKIFAFSDEILQASRAKPFLKLSQEIFGQEFLTMERNFLFKQTAKWHQLYDITTIGHEYGHILWCDEHTQTKMNKTGNYKNIEEFKATAGGLVSHFASNDENELNEQLLIDVIKRAVGLIAWMEVDEVQPYYCEGLIHLNGLFQSNVLAWEDEKLHINLGENSFETLKKWYIQTYKDLALHYLEKKDATIFLNKFAIKEQKYFMPINGIINDFVKYYFRRYKEIGQELDTLDKKSNYL